MDTGMMDRSVGELVAERPYRSRIFEKLGIDYCCKGQMALAQACAAHGIQADSVVEALEGLDAERRGEAADEPWRSSVDTLVSHIVDTHHAYLRENLPRLTRLADRVALVHGGEDPRLVELAKTFAAFRAETEAHLDKEEGVLFPFCRLLARGVRPPFPPSVAMPIAKMMAEHEDHGRNLERFRALTDAYVPPPQACNTYRALLDGLQELELDLHRHIHLENSVLFPWAERLEKGMS